MLEVEKEEKPMDLWFTYVSKINSWEIKCKKNRTFLFKLVLSSTDR